MEEVRGKLTVGLLILQTQLVVFKQGFEEQEGWLQHLITQSLRWTHLEGFSMTVCHCRDLQPTKNLTLLFEQQAL